MGATFVSNWISSPGFNCHAAIGSCDGVFPSVAQARGTRATPPPPAQLAPPSVPPRRAPAPSTLPTQLPNPLAENRSAAAHSRSRQPVAHLPARGWAAPIRHSWAPARRFGQGTFGAWPRAASAAAASRDRRSGDNDRVGGVCARRAPLAPPNAASHSHRCRRRGTPPQACRCSSARGDGPPTADRGFRHTPASRTHPTNRHRVPPPRAPPVPLPPRCLHACATRAARGGGGGGGGGRWRLVRGGHTARWSWGSLIFDADRGACAGGPSCVVYDPPAADVGGDCTRPLPPAGVCLHTLTLGRAWSLQTPPTAAAVAVGACVGGALGARRGPLCAAVEGSARPALPPAGAVLVIARGRGLRGIEPARCGATGDVRCLLSLSRRPLL